MDKDLKKIEQAAESHAQSYPTNEVVIRKSAFMFGCLSLEAKEYWQQGMYTEEQMLNMASKAFNLGIKRETLTNEWFEQNKNRKS